MTYDQLDAVVGGHRVGGSFIRAKAAHFLSYLQSDKKKSTDSNNRKNSKISALIIGHAVMVFFCRLHLIYHELGRT